MKLRSLIVAGTAAAAVCVAAPAAPAAITSQSVTGVTSGGSLAFGVVVASAFPTLGTDGAGYTSTAGVVPVVAIGGWDMTVAGSEGGKMVNTAACGDRVADTATTNSLQIIQPTALIAGTFSTPVVTSTPLLGTAVTVGSGTGTNSVNLNYNWTPDIAGADADVLPAGCALSQESTVTIVTG